MMTHDLRLEARNLVGDSGGQFQVRRPFRAGHCGGELLKSAGAIPGFEHRLGELAVPAPIVRLTLDTGFQHLDRLDGDNCRASGEAGARQLRRVDAQIFIVRVVRLRLSNRVME
jgi:hypothetical protein